MSAYSGFTTRQTPQSQPIPGRPMVQNHAGGHVFAVDKWEQLKRFLILGSTGGTYYVNQEKHTFENAQAILDCLQESGPRVVDLAIQISEEGRAANNDPVLFVLALAISHGTPLTRKHVAEQLPRAARTGTHFLHFVDFMQKHRGWGRVAREATANWYLKMEPSQLAFQVIKYRQRDGWSHRDVLRKAHPKSLDPQLQAVLRYIAQDELLEEAPEILKAAELAKRITCVKEAVELIQTYRLPRECLPSQLLNQPEVWEALLPHMPPQALLRNLNKMTVCGLLTPTSQATRTVVQRLGDGEYIRRGRLHPMSILLGMSTYGMGRGQKGSLTWDPVSKVVDALDGAFYLAFGNVPSTGKNTLLALDISGSMALSHLHGTTITPRVGSAAMAMATLKAEDSCEVVGFSHELIPLDLSPRRRLDDNVKTITDLPFGYTDCAQPMLWAGQHSRRFDTIVIYTDNETWYGAVHPCQALQAYRQQTGLPTSLIVVGMVSSRYTIADPDDPRMIDVVGFDTDTPQLITEFSRG